MSQQTNPDLIKKALQRVKSYIKNQDYDKARALLLKINHPKRDEWLNSLDSIAKRKRDDDAPKPWNPDWWAGMTFVTSPLITSFVLAWNWRRFGKKGWVLPTMAVPILFMLAIFGSLFAIIVYYDTDAFEQQSWIIWLGVLAILGIANSTFPFIIAGRQSKALKLMEEKGRRAMLAHHYDWKRGMFIWLTQISLACIVVLGVAWYSSNQTNDPGIYNDGWIAGEYPSGWSTFDVDTIPSCNAEHIDCHIYTQSRYGDSGVLIAEVKGGVRNTGEFANAIWMNTPADNRVDRGIYSISGISGNYVTYIDSTDGEEAYVTNIVVTSRNQILYIGILSSSEAVRDEHWEDIQVILHSIVWTP